MAVILSVSLPMAACASRGLDIDRLAADSSIVTGSIVTGSIASEEKSLPQAETDSEAVALAMTGAQDAAARGGLDWRNSETGARGTVTEIVAYTDDDGAECRRFTTRRERFDGVGLFHGKACRDPAGAWHVQSLESS